MTVLNENSGLIEWVSDSETLCSKYNKILTIDQHINTLQLCSLLKQDFTTVQAFIKQGEKEEALALYVNSVLPRAPMMLRRWMVNDYKDSRQWLQARTLFTETHALWSMMGYISFIR